MSVGQKEEDRLTSPQLLFSSVADVPNPDFKGSVSPENKVQSLPGDWAQYFHGYIQGQELFPASGCPGSF